MVKSNSSKALACSCSRRTRRVEGVNKITTLELGTLLDYLLACRATCCTTAHQSLTSVLGQGGGVCMCVRNWSWGTSAVEPGTDGPVKYTPLCACGHAPPQPSERDKKTSRDTQMAK